MSFSIRGLAALLVTAVAAPAQAATFTVTSTADSGNGSLREAITVMNQTAGDTHSIVFDLPPQSTIALASDLPSIGKPFVSITGPGAGDLTIAGSFAYRQIHLAASNQAFTLSGIRLIAGGGRGRGGCLLADPPSASGSIVVDSAEFLVCSARSGGFANRLAGGAIATTGRSLSVRSSFFFSNELNTTQERVGGSAISAEGSAAVGLSLLNSFIYRNRSSSTNQSANSSGAVEVLGGMQAAVAGSNFLDNSAGASPGAALFLEGTSLIQDSLFSRNGAVNGTGRGVIVARAAFPDTALRIRNTTFFQNESGSEALLAAETDLVELRNVTFEDTRSERLSGTDLQIEPRPGGSSAELRMAHTVFSRGPLNRANCSAGSGVAVQRRFVLSSRSAPGCGILRTSVDLGVAMQLDGNVLPLAAGGAAVDAGSELSPDLADWQRCMPTDARGVSRPQGGFCDLGAYEFFEAAIFANGFE